jgi:DNA polymerase (family 10)
MHSHFNLPRAEQTRRFVRAIENPHADILFHPTAASSCAARRSTSTSTPSSRPPSAPGPFSRSMPIPTAWISRTSHVRKAVEAGVKLAIDSDAHNVSHMRFPDDYGIAIARRGWATKADVINTLPVERFPAAPKGGKSKAVVKRRLAKRRRK